MSTVYAEWFLWDRALGFPHWLNTTLRYVAWEWNRVEWDWPCRP